MLLYCLNPCFSLLQFCILLPSGGVAVGFLSAVGVGWSDSCA